MMKKGLVTGLASLMVLSMAMPTMAASTISSISLELEYYVEVGDEDADVDVTTDSDKYEVDEVEVTNQPDDGWEEGDKPKIRVTLITDEDDYKFSSGISKSDVDLDGDEGKVTSVSRESTSELYVYITLAELEDDDEDDEDDDDDYGDDKYSDNDYDLDVDSLAWDYDAGVASWDGSSDARKYEVRLYRGGSAVTSVLTTTDNEYDFSEYFTSSGTYTFRVRAVYSSSNKGNWEESEEWQVTSSEASDIRSNTSSSKSSAVTAGDDSAGPGTTGSGISSSGSDGAWLQDDVGWWYIRSDRSYPANQWMNIDNAWYYFNESGYMVTGWVQSGGAWYYMDSSGAMLADTTTPDGYYVDANGVWVQ